MDFGKVMILVIAAVAIGILFVRCAMTQRRVASSKEKEIAMHRRAQENGGGGVRRETALALEAVRDLEASEASEVLDAMDDVDGGGSGGGAGGAARRGTAAALQAVADLEAAEKAAKKAAKKAKMKAKKAAAVDNPNALGEGEEQRSCARCGRIYITQSGNPVCPMCRRAMDESADESKSDSELVSAADPARLSGASSGAASEFI